MTNYKRICLTIDLKEDEKLIEKYKYHHQRENNWTVINKGIHDSGIKVMDIYNLDNRLFMICEIPKELDFDECWEKMGKGPRQAEWAKLMYEFMQALPGHEKNWVKMDLIYQLPPVE